MPALHATVLFKLVCAICKDHAFNIVSWWVCSFQPLSCAKGQKTRQNEMCDRIQVKLDIHVMHASPAGQSVMTHSTYSGARPSHGMAEDHTVVILPFRSATVFVIAVKTPAFGVGSAA